MSWTRRRPCADKLTGIGFGIYSTEEIRNLSVKEIDQPILFDVLQHAVLGGLHDPELGTQNFKDPCATCQQIGTNCTGHSGHVELPLPVYNPLLFGTTFGLLRGSCMNCNRLFVGASSVQGQLLMAQLKCLDHGLLTEAHGLASVISETVLTATVDSVNKKKPKAPAEEDGFDELPILESNDIRKMLKKEMNKMFKKAKVDGKRQLSAATTRNLLSTRLQLIQRFTRDYLFNRFRKCPNCNLLTTSLVQKNQEMVVASIIDSVRTGAPKEELSINGFDGTIGEELPFDKSLLKKAMNMPKLKLEPTKPLDDESAKELLSEMSSKTIIHTKSYLSPLQVRKHLRSVWKNDGKLLRELFRFFADFPRSSPDCPIDLLFCDALIVPAPCFRPLSRFNGMSFENPVSVNFRHVLELCVLLRHFIIYSKGGDETERDFSANVLERIQGKTFAEKLQKVYVLLQQKVNHLYDSNSAKSRSTRDVNAKGMRQILEKKQGLFRMHMMGKRVNYAARSVITPDPYMDVDGIGIPEVFAERLTFPESVNQRNHKHMRALVMNGSKYPGANYVHYENGAKQSLERGNEETRKSIAKRLLVNANTLHGCKKVYRMLQNGDFLLVNRQPTLHKPSIMAHKVHVLRGQRTFRLNYSNCKTYNADFDGDEMNAHFPQNEIAASECRHIANVINQYLVPKDGSPLGGLIQDHIISGVILTLKDQFLTKEDYHYLVLSAFGFVNKKLNLLPPAMIKPVQRWTGKQVVSTVILNVVPADSPRLNIDSKAKTSLKNWQVGKHCPDFDMSESHVIIHQCELLSGVLDKAHYGPTAYGLVHCFYELYGPQSSCNLLSCFSRLFTTFLQIYGFTLGIADVLVDKKADKKRQEVLKKLRKCGPNAVREAFDLAENADVKHALQACYSKTDNSDIGKLDYFMKSHTERFADEATRACLPHGLLQRFPNNGLLLMIECGAKGNTVNSVQMSCMLGQIELEGARPPVTATGRTLPSFRPFDDSPRAGGFVEQRFLTGIKPQEFFFHHMAGREGLIDTAVKTSRSGYLQRCIIKHMESVKVSYDLTVRDADQSVIQFYYGEDGCDIGKVQFLGEKQLAFLDHNLPALIASVPPAAPNLEELNNEKFLEIKKWFKRNAKRQKSRPCLDAAFTVFSREYGDDGATKEALVKSWHGLDDRIKEKLKKKYLGRCPDPLMSRLNPYEELGVLPESLLKTVDSLMQKKDYSEEFRKAIYLKGVRSLADPGEAVGLLAAQSIGEPSTQMTLNTFHFAGRGEMNVTLGIPRLREILMTGAENILTPAAEVHFLPHVDQELAKDVHYRMDRIYLEQVLQYIQVQEVFHQTVLTSYRQYTVSLKITKPKNRPDATKHLPCKTILTEIENHFFRNIVAEVKRLCSDVEAYRKQRSAMSRKVKDTSTLADNGADVDIDMDVEETSRKKTSAKNDDNSSSDDDMDDLGEGDGSKHKHEEDEYIGEDEEAAETDIRFDDDDMTHLEEYDGNLQASEQDEDTDDNNDDDQINIKPLTTEQMNQLDPKRIERVMKLGQFISHYEYDGERDRWCTAVIRVRQEYGSVDIPLLVRNEAKRCVVQSVSGIERCILKQENGLWMMQTQGINLTAFVERADVFDVNKIYCNDIHIMAKTYGIEAAAKTLIKEIVKVFGSYGIQINYRHLSLISDYMTHTGAYSPYNRIYMASSASPFQKMTFECPMTYLKSALNDGESDSMSNVSANIAMGQLPKIGTGCFDLCVKLKSAKEKY